MKYYLFLIVLAPLFFGTGCKDDDTTNSASLPTGTLKGRILLFDSLGSVSSDASGVVVSMEGTSLSATTDVNGVWIMSNVPTRTYTILYSRPGLVQTREPGFVFVGGDTLYHTNTTLWMPIKQRVHLSQVTTPNRVTFAGTLPALSSTYPSFALVGGVSADSAAIANSQTLGTVWAIDFENGSATGSTPFSVGLLQRFALYSAGFQSGQRLYAAMHIVALGDGYQNYTYYQDNRTGQYIFPSAGPASEVIGFTMP
ncbi:MAG: hypothetical protein JSS75_10415 [Bacteroidetes bacterium]|nr:hypothetical protein [Bacteroidota bacterium]